MLLVHSAGAVKVGEVVRYTLTYTPSADRILPSPSHLHVRIKNTSAIPLRAAYLHGPYTIHVSAYPSSYNPYQKVENTHRGVPQFEPNLKAGGHWHARLVVPDDIRERGKEPMHQPEVKSKSMTWILEVSSQILFSDTASVNFELLVGRDERSLELGFAAIASKGHGEPGRVQDYEQAQLAGRPVQGFKGVYSRAVELSVEGITALWNKPPLPRWQDDRPQSMAPNPRRSTFRPEMSLPSQNDGEKRDRKTQTPKKIHLVILTHGLHSNLSADMLYLKENIDAASAKAREDAKKRKRERGRKTQKQKDGEEDGPKESYNPVHDETDQSQEAENLDEDDGEDDEQVIVRGFPGNVVRTERGIQYLGKRLAKYILTLTYPDQPFLPPGKSMTRTMGLSFPGTKHKQQNQPSNDYESGKKNDQLPYTFTRISFIGHSLGGLTQTYAIAYIQKHSPQFFEQIKPTNFICMASPLLGLSNENPLYVKFALDFGLVGRTGQDLGLTWRAPTVAHKGWGGVLSAFGGGSNDTEQHKQEDPRSKPLLRILPTGPAHRVLKMFRNRTVYANVVNDGIVPLRTSSLMFLDWRGLERVEGARRENGLLGTMAQFGWNELTGQNTVSHKPMSRQSTEYSSSEESLGQTLNSRNDSTTSKARSESLPSADETNPLPHQFLDQEHPGQSENVVKAPSGQNDDQAESSNSSNSNPFSDFLNFFRTQTSKESSPKTRKLSSRAVKPYKRSQIVSRSSSHANGDPNVATDAVSDPKRPGATRGDSALGDGRQPPPKTSIFEAAGDIVNPPIPTESWICDPSSRKRTIFHDRVYHPEDIPSPPQKRSRLGRTFSNDSLKSRSSGRKDQEPVAATAEEGGMKVEEKIARAYHRDLSWRKVLVRLEPDAHNNMIVRRMFGNAYGWEVVKHLCDTHFSDTHAATTADEEETGGERAKSANQAVGSTGEEVHGQTDHKERTHGAERTTSENREADDEVGDLKAVHGSVHKNSWEGRRRPTRQDSIEWDDDVFEGSGEDDNEDDEDEAVQSGPFDAIQRFFTPAAEPKSPRQHPEGTHPPKPRVDTHLDTQPQVASFLTQSPQTAGPSPGKPSQQLRQELADAAATRTTLDADTIEPLQAEDALPQNAERRSGEQRPSSGTSELGLRKPPEAHLQGADAVRTEHAKDEGIAEHVARLSGSPRPDA